MSSIVHFGITPKANQVVSEELSALGIRLNKVSPGKIFPQVILQDAQPNHAIFERYLSVFCEVARSGVNLPLTRPYHVFQGTLPTFHVLPRVIFSFPQILDDTMAGHIRARYQAQEVMTRGKPAYVATVVMQDLIDLAQEPGIISTTPSTDRTMNLNAIRQYLVALKMIHAILRTNQYAFKDDNEPIADWGTYNTHVSSNRVTVRAVGLAAHTVTENGQDFETVVTAPAHMWAHNNTGGTFGTFNYLWNGPADIPNSHGLLFPFVSQLCQPDHETIPSFFYEYMLHGFGATPEIAKSQYDNFKSALGSASGTIWHDQLCHLVKVIDISLKAQCTTRIMVDAQGRYQGAAIVGGGYTLHLNGMEHVPQPQATLRTDYSAASPHISAMASIFSRLVYADENARIQARDAVGSLQQLRTGLLATSLTEAVKTEILNDARRLSFRADPEYLPITGINVANNLRLIADHNANISHLPIHPSYLLSTDRAEVVWSSFGSTAPSFRVPGGKVMSLASDFNVEKAAGKGKGTVTTHVRKIAVIIRPLSEAISDLRAVRTDRNIHNPQGNAIVNRVSSDSLIRTFEKEQADEILSGLRSFASVSVVAKSGAGASSALKRKADDDDAAGPSNKRIHLDF